MYEFLYTIGIIIMYAGEINAKNDTVIKSYIGFSVC